MQSNVRSARLLGRGAGNSRCRAELKVGANAQVARDVPTATGSEAQPLDAGVARLCPKMACTEAAQARRIAEVGVKLEPLDQMVAREQPCAVAVGAATAAAS